MSQRETYSVEITTPGLKPHCEAVGIATYIHVPGNPAMQRGGGGGWLTCEHHHRSYDAAIKCGRAINARAGVPNETCFA